MYGNIPDRAMVIPQGSTNLHMDIFPIGPWLLLKAQLNIHGNIPDRAMVIPQGSTNIHMVIFPVGPRLLLKSQLTYTW